MEPPGPKGPGMTAKHRMVNEQTRREFEQSIMTRLRGLGRRLRWYVAVDGMAWVSAAVLLAVLITLAIDSSFWLAQDMRAVQLLSLLIVIGAIAWYFMLRPLRVPLEASQLAMLVERRFPELRSRLVSAVEFATVPVSTDAAPRSPVMMDLIVRQATRQAADLPFRQALAADRIRRRGAVSLACLAALTLLGAGASGTMSLWFQRNVLLREVQWPQRNRLLVEGLTDNRMLVARGDDVTLTALVPSGYSPPRQVFIDFRAEGVNGRAQMPALGITATDPDNAAAARPRFTHTFERIDRTLKCRVSGGDARGEWFTIEVVERPQVTGVVISVDPPAYTRMEKYSLRAGTVAEALKGSGVEFAVRINKPVVDAILVREDPDGPVELGPARVSPDGELIAADAPQRSSTYHFRLTDDRGFSNITDRQSPVRISVRLLEDKPPRIKMSVRGAGDMITPEAILPVELEYVDDFGLASAMMTSRMIRGDEPPAEPKEEPVEGFEPNSRNFTATLPWPVATHGFKEGDRLILQADAADFDDIAGPNHGQSPPLNLRVVTREELLAELNRREQEYRQDFERLIRQQEELYGDLLSLETGGGKQTFPQLARRQRDQSGRVNTLRLQFEQILSEYRINQLSSPGVEARLGDGIVNPLGSVARSAMPACADAIDRLSRQTSPEGYLEARANQERVLDQMNAILRNMVKWEGFQETVALLREILKMQGRLTEETEARIEAEIFGTSPDAPSSKP